MKIQSYSHEQRTWGIHGRPLKVLVKSHLKSNQFISLSLSRIAFEVLETKTIINKSTKNYKTPEPTNLTRPPIAQMGWFSSHFSACLLRRMSLRRPIPFIYCSLHYSCLSSFICPLVSWCLPWGKSIIQYALHSDKEKEISS